MGLEWSIQQEMMWSSRERVILYCLMVIGCQRYWRIYISDSSVNQWFMGGIAPKEWRESLAKTAPAVFTEKDRGKEGITQW